MILRLIQSGGFLGKTKFAEEELSATYSALKDELEILFAVTESTAHPKDANTMRDQVQYFIEYNNRRLPLSKITMSKALITMINQLKQQLRY